MKIKPSGHKINLCFRVVVGEHDVTDASDGQMRFTPEKWISHPDYSSSTLENDFAIIILNSPITWSDKVMPICLPSQSFGVLQYT